MKEGIYLRNIVKLCEIFIFLLHLEIAVMHYFIYLINR